MAIKKCFRILPLLFVAILSRSLPGDEPAEKPKPKAAQTLLPLTAMPGESHNGPLPPLTKAEKLLAEALKRDVTVLAGDIGERNIKFHYAELLAAEKFLEKLLKDAGYKVEKQTYDIQQIAGAKATNLIVEIAGGDKKDEIVVVGAHYDSVAGCPGANDNGSGTAATLALARAFAKKKPDRTLRFVLLANEEPPWFQTKDMGSLVYAKRCKEEQKENVVAMLSLETIGYYSDEKDSQKFNNLPPLRLLYPDTGNFIAFVADVKSGPLAQKVVGKFRETTKFPAHGCALPSFIEGIGWSDHWSFWEMEYPALMVTDTATFRYPHYHLKTDTPDKLDYERTARVVAGLERVIADLAGVK